ncbi:hypothetical protein DSO57_1036010 [Entomophthora muscae]|uniref:Uncharacterized protein n=1 Tax=Entomophthora muscae TaxID=34485 RepID=A0ACC2S1G4_9FUNG|nr:hypothetical protein DSO57_1036010 [Entomophthora muscae]
MHLNKGSETDFDGSHSQANPVEQRPMIGYHPATKDLRHAIPPSGVGLAIIRQPIKER